MSPPETPNPEARSNNAILCFCIGAGLVVLSWFLGLGPVIGVALSGGDPAVLVSSLVAVLGLAMLGACGFLLALVGGVWMLVQVIADQAGDASEKRYRDVER